jgi:phosphonate transport system substrate-binding protein
MTKMLRTGTVDWIVEQPFSAAHFRERTGAHVMARRWKRGVREYRSLIFACSDSGFSTLDDLRGHKVAFEDAGLTSGYFIPRLTFMDAGLPVVEIPSPRAKSQPDVVSYVFAREEINIATWVYQGLVAAGTMSNTDWQRNDQMPQRLRSSMQIIHRSPLYPRSVALARKELSVTVMRRLAELLIAAHQDPDATTALNKFQKTTRFEAPDSALLEALTRAATVMRTIGKPPKP